MRMDIGFVDVCGFVDIYIYIYIYRNHGFFVQSSVSTIMMLSVEII